MKRFLSILLLLVVCAAGVGVQYRDQLPAAVADFPLISGLLNQVAGNPDPQHPVTAGAGDADPAAPGISKASYSPSGAASAANVESAATNVALTAMTVDQAHAAPEANTQLQIQQAISREFPESDAGAVELATGAGTAEPSGVAVSDSASIAELDIQSDEAPEPFTLPSEQQQQLRQQARREANGEVTIKQPLDLSLPEMEWGDQLAYDASSSHLLGNVFITEEKQSAMDMSGKLYWDESEEAETKPLRETITGGEVELKILLP